MRYVTRSRILGRVSLSHESCVSWLIHTCMNEWVMTHTNGSRMNESWHTRVMTLWYPYTYEWIMTHTNGSWHIWMRDDVHEWVMTHMNELCHTFGQCISCTEDALCHVLIRRIMCVMTHSYDHVSYVIMTHSYVIIRHIVWMSHDTHQNESRHMTFVFGMHWLPVGCSRMNESRHTSKWVTSHTNKSCHTYEWHRQTLHPL